MRVANDVYGPAFSSEVILFQRFGHSLSQKQFNDSNFWRSTDGKWSERTGMEIRNKKEKII